jgi:hypothetical protein
MSPARTGTKSIATRVLVLIAAVSLLALTLGAGVASANSGRDSRNAENTFTKYISSYPTMAGVVGGDVGNGTYAGTILSLTTTSTTLVLDATYHFNGSKHSFTALVHVVQTGFTNGSKAVIIGVVTDGWLKGNLVHGKYTQIACTQAPDGTCFQGTLDILRGSKSGD